MIHQMNLHRGPFQMIRSGRKTIELRLYDEKRQTIGVGDTIVFTCADEHLTAKVAALYIFDSFESLYKTLPLLQCGYTPEDVHTASPSDMTLYYSEEKQRQYGVVGIELCEVAP